MQLTKHCYCALKSFNYFCTYFCFLQIFFSQNMLQKISWSQKTWWLRKFLKILILSCNKQRCTCTFLNIERQFNHNKHYMLYTKISQNKLHYTLCFRKIQQNLATETIFELSPFCLYQLVFDFTICTLLQKICLAAKILIKSTCFRLSFNSTRQIHLIWEKIAII